MLQVVCELNVTQKPKGNAAQTLIDSHLFKAGSKTGLKLVYKKKTTWQHWLQVSKQACRRKRSSPGARVHA